jgi:hypothetical protein
MRRKLLQQTQLLDIASPCLLPDLKRHSLSVVCSHAPA